MTRRLVALGVLAVAALVLPLPLPVHAGGGCHRTGTTASGATVELSQNCMTPAVLHTDTDEVTFVNRDEVTHNVIGAGWGRNELRAGESFTHRFGEGTHLFSCTLHPGMVGGVVVGDGALQPIAAASRPDAADADGELVWGLALGVAVGALGSVGVRRLLRRREA